MLQQGYCRALWISDVYPEMESIVLITSPLTFTFPATFVRQQLSCVTGEMIKAQHAKTDWINKALLKHFDKNKIPSLQRRIRSSSGELLLNRRGTEE